MKSPIFLFSLPRSGSTLLQRVLMSHPEITSVAEPWLMLPLSYANRSTGVLTEYGQSICSSAVDDFIGNLPNKEDDYYSLLGEFMGGLYEKQCRKNEVYFLDKTPRYYFIIPEILKSFPNAKFIFLFRNPIHVMSSMINTWCDGNLRKLYAYERDLNIGPKLLSDGLELLGDKAFSIQYENFVLSPEFHTKKICEYLDLNFEKSMLALFSTQNTKGRMGDPTGVHEYKSVSTASLDKWKDTFSTPYRKKYISNYINGLDGNSLLAQGYNKKDIVEEIMSIKVTKSRFLIDRLDTLHSLIVRYSKANVFFGKTTKKWAKSRYLS